MRRQVRCRRRAEAVYSLLVRGSPTANFVCMCEWLVVCVCVCVCVCMCVCVCVDRWSFFLCFCVGCVCDCECVCVDRSEEVHTQTQRETRYTHKHTHLIPLIILRTHTLEPGGQGDRPGVEQRHVEQRHVVITCFRHEQHLDHVIHVMVVTCFRHTFSSHVLVACSLHRLRLSLSLAPLSLSRARALALSVSRTIALSPFARARARSLSRARALSHNLRAQFSCHNARISVLAITSYGNQPPKPETLNLNSKP